MSWRYLLQELPSRRFLHTQLPLTDVSLTDALSGPGGLSGVLPHDLPQLKDADGNPLIREWGAAIWAEADGEIRGGGIVDLAQPEGSQFKIECVGFSGALKGQPYTGSGRVWSKVDPLDVVRAIWDHWQSEPGGDLGVLVDGTTSPIRIGEEQYVPIDSSLSEFDTTFSDGPIRLNHYDTHDLGGMIDEWVQQGYFDYHEESEWDEEKADLVHRLRLYYPRRGKVRDDLRFYIGENVRVVPAGELPEEGFASQVMFLGAGEGRTKLQAFSRPDLTRLRHLAVVTDDKVKRQTDAQQRANMEAARRLGLLELSTLTVTDHNNAPFGTWGVGDEIRIVGPGGWVDFDTRVRIVSSTISPEQGNTATLEVKVV